ncbi:MAG: hypothetical protein EA397_14335 [Deltaproteobacteria bacterium]|nr:MAG: hypothetical protein EA397_14335 [Deltaproteobacteria bacterium]
MTTLDELLARSRAPGTFVEQRTFTLARDKAIEKMREFALRWPDRACLEVVQAANFAGARFLAVDATRGQLVIAWVGGRPFTPTQIENLFDHLFINQTDPERRHVFQLAVGINGLLQQRPVSIRIESGDGTAEGSIRFEMTGTEEAKVGRTDQPMQGTYVYVQHRLSMLHRLRSHEKGAEAEIVEINCGQSPAPILVNGGSPIGLCSRIGLTVFGVDKQRRFDFGDVRGSLAVGPDTLTIVIGGVQVVRREIFGGRIGGILSTERLRKTADMSDIVEDAAWARLLHQLVPVAKQLLGSSWSPQNLPPIPDEIAESTEGGGPAEPRMEPLPDTLKQLRPRGPLTKEQLLDPQAHPPEHPIFFIEEPTVPMIAACDPLDFPYRVLTMTQGQAATLAEHLPQLARLTQSQDVTFVKHALERDVVISTHRVDPGLVSSALGITADRDACRLEIRLHLSGHEPAWDAVPQGSGTPMLVRHKDKTLSCHRLLPELPHVSLVLTFPSKVEHHRPALDSLPNLGPLVAAEVIGAIPESFDPRASRLVRTLLHSFARPSFLRGEDGVATLRIHLPTTWESRRDSLLSAPLAEAEDGDLTLKDLVELQGNPQVRRLRDPEQEVELAPLEERFGHGHLRPAGPRRPPLAIVGRTGDVWSSRALDGLSSATELIFVDGLSTPETPPTGWRALPLDAPFLAHWVHHDEHPRDRSGGLRLLAAEIDKMQHTGKNLTEPRARQRADLFEVASLHLARLLEQPGLATLRDGAGRSIAIQQLLSGKEARVNARGGLHTHEPGVVDLTLDGLHALDALVKAMGHEQQVTLLVDDDPTVWARPETQSWLVREPLNAPGLSGWLGLRLPFDPTPSVLVEGLSHDEVLTPTTTDIPCAGVVQVERGTSLTPGMLQQIRLGALRLYELLLPWLQVDASGDPQAAAAQDYLGRYLAGRIYRNPHEPFAGLTHTIAHRLRLPEPHQAWTVERWRDADPDSRPRLPEVWTAELAPRSMREPIDPDEGLSDLIIRPINEQYELLTGHSLSIVLKVWAGRYLRVQFNPINQPELLVPRHLMEEPDVIKRVPLAIYRLQLVIVQELRSNLIRDRTFDPGALAVAIAAASSI